MKATYAKDNRNDGVYNIRVSGAGCEGREGQSIDVTTAGGKVRREVLGACIWSGLDRGGPDMVAIYAKGVVGVPGTKRTETGLSDLEKRVWTLEQTVARLVSYVQSAYASESTGEPVPPYSDADAPPPGDEDVPY